SSSTKASSSCSAWCWRWRKIRQQTTDGQTTDGQTRDDRLRISSSVVRKSVVCCLEVCCLSSSRGERALHVLDAVDEEWRQPIRWGGAVQAGPPLEDPPNHPRHPAPGQMATQAEVRPRPAEPDVVVGHAADVEAIGRREDRLVAVARAVPQDDLLALTN